MKKLLLVFILALVACEESEKEKQEHHNAVCYGDVVEAKKDAVETANHNVGACYSLGKCLGGLGEIKYHEDMYTLSVSITNGTLSRLGSYACWISFGKKNKKDMAFSIASVTEALNGCENRSCGKDCDL